VSLVISGRLIAVCKRQLFDWSTYIFCV